jgi:hypothetical protein
VDAVFPGGDHLFLVRFQGAVDGGGADAQKLGIDVRGDAETGSGGKERYLLPNKGERAAETSFLTVLVQKTAMRRRCPHRYKPVFLRFTGFPSTVTGHP